ncbi:MAG: glycosyltransferase family 39 protein [Parvularculaceae bacterium]|nr:glycosyltransferase family 39 protein [Parvularculaceae bacterium]
MTPALSTPETSAKAFLRRHAGPLFVALLFSTSLFLYWNGVAPGDAEHYINAALRWREAPLLGENHWSLRHLFVLSIAASFFVFGVSENAAIIPNVIFAALTVFITWRFARRALGEREAAIAASLIATSAFFVARPLELEVYGAEAFFAALAMWLFIEAQFDDARPRLLIAAGLAAGVATTLREQSTYLLPVFGFLLIAARRRDTIRSLLLVGAGFGAIIAVELLIYAAVAGDPFYRYRIDLGHRDIAINASMTAGEASLVNRLRRMAGYLVTFPLTTPMLAIAAAAGFHLARSKATLSRRGAVALRSFGAAAIISAIIVPAVFNLASPRYYPLLTYAAFLLTAVAIADLWTRKRPRMAVVAGAGVIAVNAFIADFSNYGEYAEAKRLATIAATSSEPIYSDPLTASRARYQMLLRGATRKEASSKIINGRPPIEHGKLFFKASSARSNDDLWCVIAVEAVRRPKWSHVLLRESGVARLVGPRLEEIVSPPPPILLIRILERPGQTDPVSNRPCIDYQHG